MGNLKASRRKRGSEMLNDGRGFSPGDLQTLMRLSRHRGVKLVNWWIYGQPAVDGVSGAFQVNPATAGAVIAALLKARGIGFEVFPRGIPVPKDLLIRFRSQTTAGVVIKGG